MRILSKFVDLNRERLDHCRQLTKQALLERRQSICLHGNTFVMWPLFFRSDTNTPESEVDTCTSALGIIAGSKFELAEDYASSEYNAVSDALSLLLYMRNDDGSWPTHISLVGRDDLTMEGVINDTFYALRALMAIGFLSLSPKIKENEIVDLKTGRTLNTYPDRLRFVEKSVTWLLNNRVRSGWRYTGIAYLENPSDRLQLSAYTTPSAHAIMVLSDVMDQLREYSPHHHLIKKIQRAIDETVLWFHDICNTDGGFGDKSSQNSRVSNTAKVILALSSVNYSPNLKEKVKGTLHKAVRWLTSHYKPDKITASDVCEEFSQIIITANGTFTRNVIHEDFLEPLLIESLIRYKGFCIKNDIEQYRKRKVNSVISLALKKMLDLQVQTGDMRGLVGSHRPIEDQRYTMYSSCDFFCAISSLIDSKLDQVFIANKKTIAACTALLLVIAVLSARFVIALDYPKFFLLAVGGITAVARDVLVEVISSIVEKHIL